MVGVPSAQGYPSRNAQLWAAHGPAFLEWLLRQQSARGSRFPIFRRSMPRMARRPRRPLRNRLEPLATTRPRSRDLVNVPTFPHRRLRNTSAVSSMRKRWRRCLPREPDDLGWVADWAESAESSFKTLA